MNGVDNLLAQLALLAEHPPRDLHYTYWLWNGGQKATDFYQRFTRWILNDTVIGLHALHPDLSNMLRRDNAC